MDLYKETQSLLSNNIKEFKNSDRRIFATSSFQTQSMPLLHLISEICADIPIVFIDTGFLFSETYQYKNEVSKKLNLNVVEISSSTSKHLQKNDNDLFYHSSDTDYCCYLNKVQPLNDWIEKGDVWISGIRKDQSETRGEKKLIEKRENDVIRFHPMLKWTGKDIYQHIKKYDLPKHPLENEGYVSIGCVPCTSRGLAESREGRWVGQKKTECGLHTDL